MTQREKMLAGQLYDPSDQELSHRENVCSSWYSGSTVCKR